jgi:hypothetical protein
MKKVIGSVHECNGLHYLDPGISIPTSSATVSPLQWHFQLYHPSLQKLRQVVLGLSPSFVLQCEASQLGKHHRSSIPSRPGIRQSSPFNVVHSNIWGPARIKSISGFQYFVIFVDDFSRMTWLFLMKD